MKKFHYSFAIIFLVVAGSISQSAEGDWPNWRGPNGDGHSSEKNVLTKWSADDITWKLDLPGEGQSSPTIWGDRIFLTTALDKGAKRVVFCVDRNKGQIQWQREAWSGEPEQTHKMNGHASASCATDGERVYAFFGKGGLHCYSVEGKPIWKRDVGDFPGKWGTGASPLLVGDLLIQNCDAAGVGLLLAVDKKTGETKWKTDRYKPQRGGWSSPILIDTGKRKEIVLNGEDAVHAYDPTTGKELWSVKSVRGRGEPTVTPAKGLLFNINGQPGDVSAIRPGGSGDVASTHLVWRGRRTTGRDQPSPIVIDNYLVIVSMSGIATCYDTANGNEIWKERLNGRFVATPIAAGKNAYFINEAGLTAVIEVGPKFKLLSTNDIKATNKEIFRASPTPSKGQMFIRSTHRLYCIGK